MKTALPLLALLATPAMAADLVEVHGMAVAHDPQLRAAHHTREAERENQPIARALVLPQVQGLAVYGVERTAIDPADGGDERTDTTDPYELGVELSQVVFDLGAFVRLRQAGDEVAAAEIDYRIAEQDLVLRTAAAYFGVLATGDDLRFARAESEALARQQAQAEGRFRAGIAAYTDVEEAKAQYDLAQAAILAAERRLLAARQALAVIIGRADVPLAVLGSDIPLPTPAPDDAEAWVAVALENNLAILGAGMRTTIAAREVGIGRSAWYPRLRLDAVQRYGETAGFNRGEVDERGVALNLEVPLFAGLERPARVRQTLSLQQREEAILEGTRRDVEREVRVAFLGVTAGAAQVRALHQAVASNQSALAATEAGLRAGTRTIVDVLVAQRQLFGAERDHALARYDYLLNVLALKRGAGSLAAADLEEINALLVGEAAGETADSPASDG
jgi:outer membrane protein